MKVKLYCRHFSLLLPKISLHNSGRPFGTSSARSSGEFGLGTGKNFRMNVDIDQSAEQYLVNNQLKPKHHPGVFHLNKRQLPQKFIITATQILMHENVQSLYNNSKKLENYLWSRHLPIEEHEYKQKAIEVENKITTKDDVMRPFLSQQQLNNLDMSRDNKIRTRLKKLVYHWEQIDYSRSKALEYLIGRSAGEYAALSRIFNEIQMLDPEFQPNTLCDFGSGLGTAVWASKSIWTKNIKEVLCVDASRDMNDLCELLLRGGNINNDHGLSSLFFRQSLPQSTKIPYDLVVSAYSLMELPSLKSRLEILDILWKKTNNYLVIVELGTNAGFKAIIEARDYILQLDKPEEKRFPDGHIFSPCPSDLICPRFAKDDIPCNFQVKYQALYPFHQDKTRAEKFCFVVLKKGPRDLKNEQWPRLIQDPMIRKRHVICRVCTKEGKLAEVVLTKNMHSQTLYRVGRKSHLGDLLPITEIEAMNTSETFDDSSISDTENEIETNEDLEKR